MSELELTLSDLDQHVVTFGMDVYPPIHIPAERTRLNMFFEAAHDRWKDSFERLEASDTVFRIWKDFRAQETTGGPSTSIPTFTLSDRGPVITLPLLLPAPIGRTKLEDTDAVRLFNDIRVEFFAKLPTTQAILRVGMVREVVFATGDTPTNCTLGTASELNTAKLVGGTVLAEYRDDKCNVQVSLRPVRAIRATPLAVGATMREPGGFGLWVKLDVNNINLAPMKDDDINEVLDRACSFWPDRLLEYVQARVGL